MAGVKDRFWRTLIRVTSIDPWGSIYVVIPGWDSTKEFLIRRDKLPDMKISEKDRFHADVNIGAERKKDIRIKNVRE